jgi:putative transposase
VNIVGASSIELSSRRAVHFGVIRHPTDQWIAQQLRNATPFGESPRFLLWDKDRKYDASFDRVAAGIDVLKTPYRAPKAYVPQVRRNLASAF